MFTKSNSTKAKRNSVPSLLAADSKFIGNLNSDGEVQLDGYFEGEIKVDCLIIGKGGVLKGAAWAEKIIVKGKVNGTLNAAQVIIDASADVVGDVYHDTLSIEAGAAFAGQIKQRQEAENVTRIKSEEKSPEKNTGSV